MSDLRFRSSALVCLGLSFALQSGVGAEMAGGAGRPATYQAVLTLSSGERCDLSVQIERVSFLLTSVANKYRFVRMLVDCRGSGGLTLSSTADRFEMRTTNAQAVPGVLSLRTADGPLWDSLDSDTRQTLAYPASIKPGAPVYLFAYFLADQVRTMPREFSYAIASVGQAVVLRQLATAA
jgi:hypothetical protein